MLRVGWRIKRHDGSHGVLSRHGWPDVAFAFHDAEEIGPRLLARIAKRTELQPHDLSHRHYPQHHRTHTAADGGIAALRGSAAP